MNGKLVLENGQVFPGIFLGLKTPVRGQLVLQTAVVGYQEILTDPVNCGRILVFTYPLIGNYGVAKKFDQSARAWVKGLVIKEKSPIYSNWQAEESFDNFLKTNTLPCLQEIDTRTLTVTLREKGEMAGAIMPADENEKDWLSKFPPHSSLSPEGRGSKAAKQASVGGAEREDYIKTTSTKKIIIIKGKGPYPLGLVDLGVTKNVLEQLAKISSKVILFPYNTRAEDILKSKIKVLIISGGPENDISLPLIAPEISKIIGRLPILAYSTGHHLLGLALGAKIYKLKLGHHGVNYPVMGPGNLKGQITVQNHSFGLVENSIKNKEVAITGYNLNDKTIEEMRSRKLKFLSCQYYLNSPGLGEINPVLKEFITRYA